MLRALLCLILLTVPSAADPLRLPGGTSVALPGTDLTVSLTDVTDARCPRDVDCIWEGTIRLELTVRGADTPPQTLVICNICEGATRSAAVVGLTLTLAGLEPSTADLAALNRPARLADYTAPVTVTLTLAPTGGPQETLPKG